MKIKFATLLPLALSFAVTFSASLSIARADETPQPLLEIKAENAARLVPNSEQVKVASAPEGFVMTIETGPEGYPGVSLTPADGATWDLSKFGHVAARVTNLGDKAASISLRVDNPGPWQENRWNTETISLQPGESGAVKTIFGFQYGYKTGYPLNAATISNVQIFAGKSDIRQTFRIESVEAAGPAGEKSAVAPNDVRIVPENGWLLGENATLNAEQISADHATAQLENNAVRLNFPANETDQKVTIKPAQGRWDLRKYLQMRVQIKNESAAPATVKLRLESNGGPSDWIEAKLDADETREVIVPFAPDATHDLSDKKKPNVINNDAVAALVIASDKADNESTITVQKMRADVPDLEVPNWLGQRPPVDGDWVQTLDENFDRPLDPSLWSVYGENYWDKQSHWSKDNVIVADGVAKLRYEKKTGFNNDDPTQKETPWQSGYLHTYDKWAQRYGYFEARMKLPKGPGLWPAFWMMPDRGRGDKTDEYKRQSTENGGMEFDIMEHLTRWGPNRYNIAMHYDGYGKQHQSIGSDKLYLQPDKDGYITTGLLWTPGVAVYYANGRELARWENPRISSVPEILMFTLPMGGWDNSALDETKLPDDFTIDYVRVWQRKDLAEAGDGTKPLN